MRNGNETRTRTETKAQPSSAEPARTSRRSPPFAARFHWSNALPTIGSCFFGCSRLSSQITPKKSSSHSNERCERETIKSNQDDAITLRLSNKSDRCRSVRHGDLQSTEKSNQRNREIQRAWQDRQMASRSRRSLEISHLEILAATRILHIRPATPQFAVR